MTDNLGTFIVKQPTSYLLHACFDTN